MSTFLTPRWIAAHIFVVAVVGGCLSLGRWQLDRLEERRLTNQVDESRYTDTPTEVTAMVAGAGADLETLTLRRATATGVYVPQEEVLVRSQVHDGQAGFDVVTPILLANGQEVFVNRGWVPLDFDSVPVTGAPPPDGTVTVEGIVRGSQQPTSTSRDEVPVDGRLTIVSRIDLTRLAGQTSDELLPVYLELVGSGISTELPFPASTPDFSDEGPHLDYALQWFSFALVGIVGYVFLLRRASRRPTRLLEGTSETFDDLDVR